MPRPATLEETQTRRLTQIAVSAIRAIEEMHQGPEYVLLRKDCLELRNELGRIAGVHGPEPLPDRYNP